MNNRLTQHLREARRCREPAPAAITFELFRSWTLTATLLHLPLCAFTIIPPKSKSCQECLVCLCSVLQGIGRRNITVGEVGLYLLLNLGLPPSRKRDWLKGSQNNSIYCHVFHQIRKGIMTPAFLPKKIMNHCIRLSLITALKLYDSKY